MFFGTYQHAIDAKGRTSLPARVREALVAAGEPKVFLARYAHWRAVHAIPLSVWKELEKKLLAASPFDLKAQLNISRLYSTAHEVDLDVHGRVLVPPALREWAGLKKDVVWVGMANTMHLWDRDAYEQHMATEIPEEQRVDFLKA